MSDCIEWPRSRDRHGYGQVWINGGDGRKKWATHRFAYTLEHGPIPDGMVVMHTCDNPPCVNPEHLTLGTHADNAADRTAKGRCASKVSWADVEAIRADRRVQRVIAEEYGIGQSTVSEIKSGHSWKRGGR